MSEAIAETTVGKASIRLVQGDITLAETDAIVNAANSYLGHGGGVAAAISRRGGPAIERESDAIGFCAEGDAVVTGGGNLAARYVIHTVGPKGDDPAGDEKLASAVHRSLERAEELGLESISFPAISSGIFGFPKDRCAAILLATVVEYLTLHPGTSLGQVHICLFDDETVNAFRAQWDLRYGRSPVTETP
jgi:O-acetyl-ADP-ribose deacetylase